MHTKMEKNKKFILKELYVNDAEIELNDKEVIVKGPLGMLKKKFLVSELKLEKNNGKIVISSKKSTKREKKAAATIAAHIKNMISGVTQGHEYKLQICSVHFPITVAVDNTQGILKIKNFLGETKERVAKILPGVNVNVQGDIIIVKGIDKEAAGQTAANIETATRIRGRDRRIFQDGIYIIEKNGIKI